MAFKQSKKDCVFEIERKINKTPSAVGLQLMYYKR